MSEKQKRDGGELYDPVSDEQLMKELIRAKDLCFKYNNISPIELEKRNEIIKDLFGKTGENFNIMPYFWCDYGYNIEIGDNFFSNHNCVMLDCAKIKFGDNIFMGPDCGFYTAGHPDSASSQFFIVHKDSTYLDGSYAVFGYITEGMDVVDKVCKDSNPVDDNGTIPASQQPIINSITIRTE